MKILLADRNEANQLFTEHALSQRDILADVVQSPHQIQEKLDSDQYALVLMDLNMLVGNEIELPASLLDQLQDIPLVAFTESESTERTYPSGKLPIDEIIHKPYEMMELFQTIEKHIPSQGQNKPKETWEEFKKSLFKYADQSADFAYELVDCFIENYQEFKEQLAIALSEKNVRLFKEACHKIETSNRIFQVTSLENTVGEIGSLIESAPSSKDFRAITRLTLGCNAIMAKLNYVKQNIKR